LIRVTLRLRVANWQSSRVIQQFMVLPFKK
jgi:hypothetical protein